MGERALRDARRLVRELQVDLAVREVGDPGRHWVERLPCATPSRPRSRRARPARALPSALDSRGECGYSEPMTGAKHARRISAEEAAALVKSGDWVDYGLGLGQPDLFDRALARRKDELRGVRIRACLTLAPRAVLEADATGEHFLWFNWHFSGYDRAQHDDGRCNYIPMNFGEAPGYYRRFIDPIEVVCITTCPVDARIAAEIEDGSCLQIGIGGMPNAVCSLLKEAGVRDLGVHTEMFVDGMVDLVEAGLITGARKAINPYQMVFTFAAGSRRQYDFIDRNPRAQSYPVDYTNLPEHIVRNERVVSINNTTQIDLQGQAASESAGHRHLTGTGGQLQFVRGAYASRGGKSFICLSSTYEKRGERQSRVVSTLTPGNVVTTPRTDVMYVVTEYGIVNLKGTSVAERVKARGSLARPAVREQLEREARTNNLLPKGFW